jgi:hypothetical protein
MRSLGASIRILVASPQLASQVPSIEHLNNFPTLATDDASDDLEWYLESEDGHKHIVRAQPRMGCEDMATVRLQSMAWVSRSCPIMSVAMRWRLESLCAYCQLGLGYKVSCIWFSRRDAACHLQSGRSSTISLPAFGATPSANAPDAVHLRS